MSTMPQYNSEMQRYLGNNNTISTAFYGQALAPRGSVADALEGTGSWMNAIRMSLLGSVDLFGQSRTNYLVGNTPGSLNSFALEARLNIDATVNEWVSAHASGLYASNGTRSTNSSTNFDNDFTGRQPSGIQAGYGSRYYATAANATNGDLDQAYITLGNTRSYIPFSLTLGRQYYSFGQYDLNTMWPTLTQEFSELRGTGVEARYNGNLGTNNVGVIKARVYALNGLNRVSRNDNLVRNYGIELGYGNYRHPFGVDLSAGLVANMNDVGIISVQRISLTNNTIRVRSGYNKSVPGLAVNGNISFNQQLFLSGQYVGALRGFNRNDFVYSGFASSTKQARPSAYMVKGGYRFKMYNRASQLALSYQGTSQASATPGVLGNTAGTLATFNLPKHRYNAELNVGVLKNTQFSLLANYDQAYKTSDNNTGRDSFTGMARMSVFLS
ncbi:MAG: LbtU family siderophore porin [Pseudomonadota bacterium]